MKVNKMGVWSHIILEGYCMYNADRKRKTITVYEWKNNKHNSQKIDNPHRILLPRPKWCQKKYKNGIRIPCFECLCDPINEKKCPHFAYSDGDNDIYEAHKIGELIMEKHEKNGNKKE